VSPGPPRRSVEEVLDAVRAIPEGFVRTYGDLSPGAPRFTGAVLRGTGDEVPWWRVVHADGTLAVGEEQRRRLEAEGAPFLPGKRARLDMRVARLPDGLG
jgi:methylated-DNA-protein-cysteine methyltransferase-like protein